jgi:hypothetical protein
MSFQQWTAVGRRLACVSSASSWALGDWLLFGQRTFGHRYRRALASTNLDYQTLRNYAWVAGRFPPARRRDALSFQHHAEVASLPEPVQDLWLARAEAGCWSRNELRRQMRPHRRPAHTVARPRTRLVTVALTLEDEERWQRAAASTHTPLLEWLHAVADAAADATLQSSDPELRAVTTVGQGT